MDISHKMTSTISNILIPSKTFILGEYSVLSQGKALLLAHEPYFILSNTIKSNSPNSHPILDDLDSSQSMYNFIDPHQGKGGFGASSAIVLGYSQLTQPNSLKAAWALNQHYHPNGSGADIICQYAGGLTSVNVNDQTFHHLSLPENLDCIVLRSGIKIPTHTHLHDLKKRDFTELSLLIEPIINKKNLLEHELIDTIQRYESLLRKMTLRSPAVIPMIDWVQSVPEVIAAKGCGALGADVIIAICQRRDYKQVASKLAEKFEIIANLDQIGAGIQ